MTKRVRFSGFTLIELLIVIGLLAALASVLLPSLMGSREDALEGIDAYNAAGTLRTLRQYESMTGKLPSGFHTGLDTNASSAALMEGIPATFKGIVDAQRDIKQLTDVQSKALADIGIGQLAYGEGDPSSTDPNLSMGYSTVSESDNPYVILVNRDWAGEDGPLTFNGKGIAALQTEGYNAIIALFVTPTVDWSDKGVGWVKGFSVKMDVPGKCPIPEGDFAYYMAYVGIRDAGTGITYSGDTSGLILPNWAASDTAATTAVNGVTVSNPATLTYVANTDSSTGGTLTYDADGAGTVSSPVTIGVKFTATEAGATLLGTSCPECGVTNP
jgi:prepilin-type N-terminal cleavage/methylation domain-containing protein